MDACSTFLNSSFTYFSLHNVLARSPYSLMIPPLMFYVSVVRLFFDGDVGVSLFIMYIELYFLPPPVDVQLQIEFC